MKYSQQSVAAGVSYLCYLCYLWLILNFLQWGERSTRAVFRSSLNQRTGEPAISAKSPYSYFSSAFAKSPAVTITIRFGSTYFFNAAKTCSRVSVPSCVS